MNNRGSSFGGWAIRKYHLYILFVLIWQGVFAQDQLIFKNGDVISGKYLGKTDSIVYFESSYFGTLRVSLKDVEVKREDSAPAKIEKKNVPLVVSGNKETNTPMKPKEQKVVVLKENNEKPELKKPSDRTALNSLWLSTEKTLNRFVHDRKPTWFPTFPKGWKGDLSLGLNITESVKTSTRYHGAFNIEGDKDRSNYKFRSHYAYAQQDKKVSEDDWGASARYRYKLKNTDFFEGQITHDVDYLSDPKYRSTLSIGFGLKPINNKKLKFDYVLGGAVEQLDRRKLGKSQALKVNVNENFKYQYSKHLTLTQNLRFYADPSDEWNYNFRFESGLKTLIIGALNLGVSYRMDYDSTVKDSDKRQKSKIITSLGVKF